MDRMRESIFAVLGDLSGLSFLDLFAGSGIISLEAASRGAAYLEAVEAGPEKRAVLLANVAASPARVNCRFMSVELYALRARRSFDLIFCDPPFPTGFKNDLVEKIAASRLMISGSRLLIHHPAREIITNPLLNLINKREFGNSVVDFFLKV
jgi:16S rRNA (guanine(966)-N(2))-methyltransferase RsmD